MANPTQSSSHWNAITTPWLEVMDLAGSPTAVSVLDALRNAAELHVITTPNPLDLFAIHRFLLTLLYWKAPEFGGIPKLRESLLRGRVPRDMVAALKADEALFNLFDPKKPFLQDLTAREAKDLPASSLFAEMASGTNVAHFHHGDDDDSRLCLRCATLGLLRLIPWTQSGGSGKQPSIHGAPPMMALAAGRNLCETLGLNVIPTAAPLGKPQWSGQFKPKTSKGNVPLLEGLTWNPRRVYLREPDVPALCCNCGATTLPTVGPIVFEKNPACTKPSEDGIAWRDPAAFYKATKPRPLTSSRESDAAVADDLRRLFELHFGKKTEAAPIADVVAANTSHRHWLVVVPCTNPANNKSYDHRLELIGGFGGDAPKRASLWPDRIPWQADDARHLVPHRIEAPSKGMFRFVRAAAALDAASWGALANAAERGLDEDPAAFDIFTGVYWPLRGKQDPPPSKAASWMALKLMATAGQARPSHGTRDGSFRPWEKLRIAASPAKKKLYPRAVPQGRTLEAELREIIRKAVADSPTTKVSWAGLCQFLHKVTP